MSTGTLFGCLIFVHVYDYNLQLTTLQVLADSDLEKETKLALHITRYPVETTPLTDSATSLGGMSRTAPSSSTAFIPVGHISLDSQLASDPDSHHVNGTEHVYAVTTFYISRALHSGGLGRAAMVAVETMAKNEPLCAMELVLDTPHRDEIRDLERYTAFGHEPPKVSLFAGFLKRVKWVDC